MKLVQNIITRYYSLKIWLLAQFSPRSAASCSFQLFCTPFAGRNLPKSIPTHFSKAKPVEITVAALRLHGWHWEQKNNFSKKILIVHGFNSYAFKFEPYAKDLYEKGYEVLAFDAPAHGSSEGKTITALLYRDMILTINNQFGNLYGIMAHSLGGLAATLAAIQLPQLQKLVLIAPVTQTTTALESFSKLLQIPGKVVNEMVAMMETLANSSLKDFSVSNHIHFVACKTLWIHDEDDAICPIADVTPIMKAQPSHIQFTISKGLGHNQIYRDKNIQQQIVNFL
ncbi:MAG: alpha/beta hydrolase [Bacteroidota bacterium]|nr:alpha/beta hydrolase [Bacteroidota bacterium]